jgi:peptidoglycan/xylan/chitin deacetylase (PgdA/CDA1 family)
VSGAAGRGAAKRRLAAVFEALGLPRAFLRWRQGAPLVLRYHRVYPDGARPFYRLGVERHLFDAQLDFLRQHFDVLPLSSIVEALRADRPLPRRALAITFDDGYRDNLTEAWPALEGRGIPATVFVTVGAVESGKPLWWDRLAAAVQAAPDGATTAKVGLDDPPEILHDGASRVRAFDRVREAWKQRPWHEVERYLARCEEQWGGDTSTDRLLTREEVAQLAREGCEIGSHTLDHPILSRLDPGEAERQIVESRRRLEDWTGARVRYFSYPNGKRDDVTPQVEETVRRAGYEGAVSTIEGRVTRRSDPFLIERKGATEGMCSDGNGDISESLFTLELSGFYDLVLQRRRRDRGIY